MWDEGHFDDLRAHLLTPDIDFNLYTGLCTVLRQIRGSNRGVDRRGHRAAAHDVHLCAIEKHGIAGTCDYSRLGDLESHEPPRDALQLLALQGVETGERRAFVEFHDEAQGCFVRRCRIIDVVAV